MSASAASATGVEPSREMIAAGAVNRLGRAGLTVLQGDAAALPVPADAFDVAWCRLVLGHVRDLAAPYAEMARALVAGGNLIVSDFHPAAHARGHRRTFRGEAGVAEIESYPHAIADHILAAEDAGLVLLDGAEAAVGPTVRHLYAEAGRLALYDAELGLPLVFALKFERI
jgi:malonyl-CoA O-methyltransferase